MAVPVSERLVAAPEDAGRPAWERGAAAVAATALGHPDAEVQRDERRADRPAVCLVDVAQLARREPDWGARGQAAAERERPERPAVEPVRQGERRE